MKTIFAYVDPGLGLLAWQALVAVVLGLVFYVKKTREKVLGLLSKRFRKKQSPQEGPASNPAPRDEAPP
jgi:hypothetical protein